MKNIYPELALFGRTNECARTDSVFFPTSEVTKGTVSLKKLKAGVGKSLSCSGEIILSEVGIQKNII